jgi:APA family basic amino acid/polyamine antiporter
MRTRPPVEVGAGRLRRDLGPVELTASGVGIIIGAGIYVLLGAATARAGTGVWLAFLLAAVLCALTGLSYAELASMFPTAGAEFDYTRRVLPRTPSFLVGWAMATGLMVAAAAIAVGFGHYLTYFIDVPVAGAAAVLLAVEAAIASSGVRRSARVVLGLSVVQVTGLLIVIAIGAPHIGTRSLVGHLDLGGVLGGTALVFFAFIGFDEVITLAEETRDPTRVVPRALLAALAISAALYMAVAVAAVSVIGPDELGRSSRPLTDVIAHVLQGRAEAVVAVIALVSTLNTSLLALTAASRLLYGMAAVGALPASLADVAPRTGVPRRAVLVAAAGAIGCCLLGPIALIAGVTDFAVYVVFLAVDATVVILRVRSPELARPFRVPGAIGRIPVVPVAGFAAAAVMLPQLEARSLALGGALLGAGLVVHLALGRERPWR